jgi:hypothetical protein
MNFRDLPQQVTALNRRIILRHTVAPGNQEFVIPGKALAYDAVNEKTVPACV